MNTMIKRLSTALAIFAAVLFYLSQRYSFFPLIGLYGSAGLFILALVFNALGLKKSQGRDKEYLRVALLWKLGLGFAGLLHLTIPRIAVTSPLAASFVTGTFIIFLVISLFVGFGIELTALRPFAFDTQNAVSRRWRSSLTLALLFLGLLAINYAAFKRDKVLDLTFLKASAAGEATQKIVARLEAPLRVGIFFTQESEVLPLVKEYFAKLPAGKLQFEYYDKDFNPAQAEEFRVSKNGQVVLMQGEKRQRFDVGDRMDEGRRNLRSLDATFQKTLLALTSEPSLIYFTATHGEMLWESGGPLRSLAFFEEILRNQNFKTRRLTAMFHDVPEEAKILAIMGPTSGFAPEEIEALKRYVARGGRILLALDIDRGSDEALIAESEDLPKFLDSMGLHYNKTPIAHDERFVTNSRQKSDHYFIFSNKFAKHPASATLSANSDRLTVMSFRSGSFDIAPASADWTFTPLIQSITGSFRDENGNFDADKNESRDNSYVLSVAGETKGAAKIVAFADASIFADSLMKVSGNQLAALDAVRWLSDRSEQAGAIESEEDVLVRQENARELIVFHASIYLVPLLVLGLGFFVNRRKKG